MKNLEFVDNLWKVISTSQAIRSISLLSSGTIIGSIISIIFLPIITRFYTPQDLGYLSSYIAIISIILVISLLGFHLAIPIASNDEEAFNLFVLALISLSSVCLLILIVFFINIKSVWLLGFLKSANLNKGSFVLAIASLWFASIYQNLSYWSIRFEYFLEIAQSRIYQSAATTAMQVVFGVMHLGFLGLFIADVIARCLAVAPFQKRNVSPLKFLSHDKGKVSYGSLKSAIRKYWKFPVFSMPASLFSNCSSQLPIILLAVLYDPTVAGFFGLSHRIIGAPMILLGSSVRQVYTNRASYIWRLGNAKALAKLFVRYAAYLAMIIVIPLGALAIWGKDIFGFIFGSDWLATGEFVRALSLMYMGQFSLAPLEHTFEIIGYQNIRMYWDLIRLILTTSTLLLASWFDISALHAVTIYGAFGFCSYVFLFIITYILVKKSI